MVTGSVNCLVTSQGLYISRVKTEGTGSVVFTGLFHSSHLKTASKSDLPSYYLPSLSYLTAISKLSIIDFLTYWGTGLLHKGLVLYKGTNKGTGRNLLTSMPGA